MKPSEEIAAIKAKLISGDWVAWGGNRHSREGWEEMHKDNPAYWFRAILDYLDKKVEDDARRREGTVPDP